MTTAISRRESRERNNTFADQVQGEWRAAVENRDDMIIVRPTRFHDRDHIDEHCHSRSQLLYAMSGVVTVTTSAGRWMLPPEHALWIPASVVHAVDIDGNVELRSVYVKPDAIEGLPRHLHVAALTPLMRNLIIAASELFIDKTTGGPLPAPDDRRSRFIMGCLLHEIPNLPERPLGLALPADQKLASLCHAFLATPSPHGDIGH